VAQLDWTTAREKMDEILVLIRLSGSAPNDVTMGELIEIEARITRLRHRLYVEQYGDDPAFERRLRRERKKATLPKE
jgi:hypothetical protein